MIIVPFIGLSILIHILIIIFYSTFHMGPSNKRQQNRYLMFNKFFGSIIIIFVFSFVLISATSLIRLSVTDKHSTWGFIENSKILPVLANDLYSATIRVDRAS